MIRTFHPVGQGAYYTEQFFSSDGSRFNMVYDCGSESLDGTDLSEVIHSSFNRGEEIDAVYISHFDRDHVSGLPILLNWCTVKKMYLPVVTSKAEVAYWRFKSLVDIDEKRGFHSPVAYHLLDREGTNVEEYFRRLGCEHSPEIERVEPTNIENPSLCPNKCTVCQGWEFVPYNFQRPEVEPVFRQAFEDALMELNNDVSVEEFIADPKIVLGRLDEKRSREFLAKINKSLRSKLGHEINCNSMALYSGQRIDGTSTDLKMMLHCDCEAVGQEYKAGCLYFGDYEAKRDDAWAAIRRFYEDEKCWDGIGCVQLPHHGSRHNYNKEFESMNACFVASFGLGNKHHHPGWRVIVDLMRSGKPVFFSTEAQRFQCRKSTRYEVIIRDLR